MHVVDGVYKKEEMLRNCDEHLVSAAHDSIHFECVFESNGMLLLFILSKFRRRRRTSHSLVSTARYREKKTNEENKNTKPKKKKKRGNEIKTKKNMPGI